MSATISQIMSALDVGRAISKFLFTLHLFTRNDIPTTIIPTTLFALVAAPLCSPYRCVHVVWWIWLHLLHFNVANQVIDPTEDRRNKASRPIPAGYISLRDAVYLRWFLVPICLVSSAFYSIQVFSASIAITLLTLWYNEFKAHSHWFSKNLMTGVGYACFQAGATLIAGKDISQLEPNAVLAVLLSIAMFATTLQAQDFKDQEGDRSVGRRTLPIAHPSPARMSMFIGLPMWSICLAYVWGMDAFCSVAFVLYSGLVGLRFMVCKTTQADRLSCQLYTLVFCRTFTSWLLAFLP
ncbi:UbiA prenyltransferase family-domain-containing protein [Suillus bovinus]|uniref:UbiA prenyltransferase family-domain-containing protein n=1 Tax=Suillus bovinus TaxID=48563 RepID=UPI001B88438C|nr:UbiA prenyltransferase family-domain-containing protein [Suillus bovinus]KAG2151561.1 UbiA prenyltransferase family-domain-containing protein [Suillus bovinus]